MNILDNGTELFTGMEGKSVAIKNYLCTSNEHKNFCYKTTQLYLTSSDKSLIYCLQHLLWSSGIQCCYFLIEITHIAVN